jgi:hypothetical protein
MDAHHNYLKVKYFMTYSLLVLGIERRIILKYLTDTGWEGVEWIHLPEDRVQWQALVYAVMKL